MDDGRSRSERWYRWLDHLGQGRPAVAYVIDVCIGVWEYAKLALAVGAGLLGGFYLTVAPGWNKLLGVPCIVVAYLTLGRLLGRI